jgi:hypothetical protein
MILSTTASLAISLLVASSINTASAFVVHQPAFFSTTDTHLNAYISDTTGVPPSFVKPPTNVLLPSPSVKQLTYESIQDIIDVSRPYYKLQNEANIADPLTGESLAFISTVIPEMPLSYENGSMSAAEAGRHGAIAGSVAAALNNRASGKFYYLALDAEIRKKPINDVDSDMMLTVI